MVCGWSAFLCIMNTLQDLLENNRHWSERIRRQDPQFFEKLAHQQAPQYLWIGCSDSRVPANDIVGMMPGELFVHRNIANVVVHTDLNCLSVIQFAVELLKVRHVIVCGHYGCSGVRAALRRERVGLADNWLRHVQDVRQKHESRLPSQGDEEQRHHRLCEFNVIEQVANVCQTSCVQDAWARRQDLTIHGWIYGLRDGLIRDLNTTVSLPDEAEKTYETALAALQ
jgi:carbonic anhydrase